MKFDPVKMELIDDLCLKTGVVLSEEWLAVLATTPTYKLRVIVAVMTDCFDTGYGKALVHLEEEA